MSKLLIAAVFLRGVWILSVLMFIDIKWITYTHHPVIKTYGIPFSACLGLVWAAFPIIKLRRMGQ